MFLEFAIGGSWAGKPSSLLQGVWAGGETPKGRRIVNEASVQVQSKSYVNSRNIAKLLN